MNLQLLPSTTRITSHLTVSRRPVLHCLLLQRSKGLHTFALPSHQRIPARTITTAHPKQTHSQLSRQNNGRPRARRDAARPSAAGRPIERNPSGPAPAREHPGPGGACGQGTGHPVRGRARGARRAQGVRPAHEPDAGLGDGDVERFVFCLRCLVLARTCVSAHRRCCCAPSTNEMHWTAKETDTPRAKTRTATPSLTRTAARASATSVCSSCAARCSRRLRRRKACAASATRSRSRMTARTRLLARTSDDLWRG